MFQWDGCDLAAGELGAEGDVAADEAAGEHGTGEADLAAAYGYDPAWPA